MENEADKKSRKGKKEKVWRFWLEFERKIKQLQEKNSSLEEKGEGGEGSFKKC